jgi:O-antigen ligase
VRPPARATLDAAVPLTLAATVFMFACGSSSVDAIFYPSQNLRWVGLAVLFLLALWWAPLDRLDRAPALGALGAGALLVGLAALSAAWSVEPRLTLGRAGSLGLLLATAALLGLTAAERRGAARRLALGLLGGAVAVAIASLVVLAYDPGNAVQDATSATRAKLRGLTENPNELSMLMALGLPFALAPLLSAGLDRRRRIALACAALLLFGELVAADSRGAYVAAAVGLAAVVALAPGRVQTRLATGAGIAAVFLAGIALGQLGETARELTAPAATTSVDGGLAAAYPDLACVGLPPDDVGQPPCGQTDIGVDRSSVASSGRTDAWRGALGQALQRPLLGYGFGTEDEVFIERYTFFQGDYVENSYLGMLLQLGAAGLAALVAVLVAAGLAVRQIVALEQEARAPAAACASVALTGAVLGLYQSFLYSAGNIGAGTVWVSLAVAASVCTSRAHGGALV